MGYRIVVVGATGTVGHELLTVLAEREFPADQVVALAPERSAGREVSFGDGAVLKVLSLEGYDFRGADLVLFAAGGRIAATFAPKAAAAGAIVIDTSEQFRLEPDVPLVVPEVNPEDIGLYPRRRIIASPSAVTIQLAVALKPLHDLSPVRRVVVSTFQSVSGAGKDAMDELFNQTRAVYVNDTLNREQFAKQIAFNVIPQVDGFRDDGFTAEEWAIRVETRKVLDAGIEVVASCVRVPVFIGHGAMVHVELDQPLALDQARAALTAAPGVSLVDHRTDEGFVTPVEAAGEDSVFVSRLRQDPSVASGLAFWCVADNLRKGAALNAVQIAEALVDDYL